jgi:hypothetical protein
VTATLPCSIISLRQESQRITELGGVWLCKQVDWSWTSTRLPALLAGLKSPSPLLAGTQERHKVIRSWVKEMIFSATKNDADDTLNN